MQARVFIPMIDLAFLSLGAVVAILSQTQLIRSFAVEITDVDEGIAVISRETLTVIAVTRTGMFIDGAPATLDDLAGGVGGELALLRVDEEVSAERVVEIMGTLAREGVELRIEVEQRR